MCDYYLLALGASDCNWLAKQSSYLLSAIKTECGLWGAGLSTYTLTSGVTSEAQSIRKREEKYFHSFCPLKLKGLSVNLTSFVHVLNFVSIRGMASFILFKRV